MNGCMRCLYCGKQLALFRRLTGGSEFCSEAHKHSYHEEYNRLALNRLLQAQSKSDETKPALKVTGSPLLIASVTPRETESTWTPSPPTGQKRLIAPIEAPPTGPVAPPPQASFIVEIPTMRIPGKVETPPWAVQVFAAAEMNRPMLPPRAASLILSATRLFKLSKIAGARRRAGPLEPPAAAWVCSLACPLNNPILDLVTGIGSFEPAGLVPLEVEPMLPVLREVPLDSMVHFVFLSILEMRPEPAANNAHGDIFNQVQLAGLLSLKVRPIAPPKLEPASLAVPLMAALELTLPVNNPLPLRPRAAMADSGKTREALVKAKLAMALGKPAPHETKAQPGTPDSKEPPQADGVEVDLPPFLRDREDKSGKRWGSLQKYLKNLVGCLVFASLCGIEGNSGEAGRLRPEHLAALTRSPSVRSE